MSDGPLLASLNAAKAMLRDCYYWRALKDPLAIWDTPTAAEHIYFDGLPPASPGPDHSRSELVNLRPFALMWADTAGGLTLRQDATGPNCLLHSGSIIIQIEMNVPADLADDPTALAESLMQSLGRIMKSNDGAKPGLFELSDLAGYLPLRQVKLIGYMRTDAKAAIELGDAVVAELELSWGVS